MPAPINLFQPTPIPIPSIFIFSLTPDVSDITSHLHIPSALSLISDFSL